MLMEIPQFFAHRGCKTLAPENTLAAFQKVLDNNIKAIELDVHICATGELVIIHDFRTKRMSGVDYQVSKTDFDTLRALNMSTGFKDSYEKTQMPTLEEVFKLLGKNVFYDIEVKSENIFFSKKLVDDVIALVDKFGLREQSMISSFNPFIVRNAVKKGFPRTAVIFAEDDDVPFIFKRGFGYYIAKCTHLKPGRHIILDGRLLKSLKKKGIPLMTWTVDDVEEAKKLIEMGTIGICSNRAEYIIENIK